MSNKIETIPLKGIIRSTPDTTGEDGAAQEVINLRPQNGAWHNVENKEGITKFYSDRIMSMLNKPYFFPKFYRHPALPDKCYVSYWDDKRTIEMCAFCLPDEFNALWGSQAPANQVMFQQFWNDNGTWNDTLNGQPVVWHDFDGIFTIPTGETFKTFAHLNNILVVVTDVNRYYFLWDYETLKYSKLEDIPLLNVNVQSFLGSNDLWFTGTPVQADLEFGKGLIYEKINLNKQISYICGKVLCRIGYELYDGSIVGESDLYLISSTCLANTKGVNLVVGGGQLKLYATFAVPIIYFKSSSSINATLLEYARLGIISSVKVFCSDVISIADIETFNTSGAYNYHESINKNLENILLYEVYSEEIKLFLQGMTSFSYELNFAAKKIDFTQIETFPLYTPNTCTMHKLVAETYFNYNERLHLVNITNILFKGYEDIFKTTLHDIDSSYSLWTSPYVYNYDIVVDIEIKTDKGIKYVRRFLNISDLTLFEALSGELCLQIQKIITYPDYRAKKIFIMSKDRTTGETRLLIPEINLTSSLTQNVAYNVHDENGSSQLYEQVVLYPSSTGQIINHALNDSYSDTNRIQVSEQSNLFIFPAKNSYRFGELDNVVVGIETVAGELSATRFGQFPIYVFTNEGIWSLESGTGEILYQSITTIDSTSVINANCIINLNGMIGFMTNSGMKVISGRNVIEISQQLEGNLNNQLLQCPEYLAAINSASTVKLLEVVNKTTAFLDEINTLKGCFDREMKEMYLTSPVTASIKDTNTALTPMSDYNYSYIFGKESKQWYKIKSNYVDFIHTFAGTHALSYTNLHLLITDIEREKQTGDVYTQFLWQSRACKLHNISYKKLQHIVFRLYAELNTYVDTNVAETVELEYKEKSVAVQIYGSPDNIEYKLVGSGITQKQIIQDIMLRKTYASCRYFIFLIVGDAKNVTLEQINVELIDKYVNKLR